MLEMARLALPVFVSVAVKGPLVVPISCAAKVRLPGLSVAPGVGSVPVPLSETECGVPGASSVTVTAALRLPSALGVKVTEIVQVALTARLEGQLCDELKSEAFVPVTPIEEIASGA